MLCDLNDPPNVGGAVHIGAQLLGDRVHTLQHLQQDINHHTLKLILGVELLNFDKIDLKAIFLRSFNKTFFRKHPEKKFPLHMHFYWFLVE